MLAATVAGCAAQMPTFGEAERIPLNATREVRYDLRTPQGDPVTLGMVASALTEGYVRASRFEAAESEAYSPASSSVNLAGVSRRGPMTRFATRGVQARQTLGQTIAEYVNVRQTVEGTGQSVTTVTLAAQAAGEPGRFRVAALTLAERIGVTPGLPLPLPPLGSKQDITADVAQIVATMKLDLPVSTDRRLEANVPYPVPSVFANYVRALGTPTGTSQTPGDSRTGQFKLPRGEVAPSVTVTVVPYRDGSKVTLVYPVGYLMKEGGGNTYQPDRVEALGERLRRVATE